MSNSKLNTFPNIFLSIGKPLAFDKNFFPSVFSCLENEKCIKAFINDAISKPFKSTDLLYGIQKHLRVHE